MQNRNLIILIFSLISLYACGGGGSNTSSTPTTPPPPTEGSGGSDNSGGSNPTTPTPTDYKIDDIGLITDKNVPVIYDFENVFGYNLVEEGLLDAFFGQNYEIEIIKEPTKGNYRFIEGYAFMYYTPNENIYGRDEMIVKLSIDDGTNYYQSTITLNIKIGYFEGNNFPFIFAADTPFVFQFDEGDNMENMDFNLAYIRQVDHTYSIPNEEDLIQMTSDNYEINGQELTIKNIDWEVGKYNFLITYNKNDVSYSRFFTAYYGERYDANDPNSPLLILKSKLEKSANNMGFFIDGFTKESMYLAHRDVVNILDDVYADAEYEKIGRIFNYYVSTAPSEKDGIPKYEEDAADFGNYFKLYQYTKIETEEDVEVDDEPCSPYCFSDGTWDVILDQLDRVDYINLIGNDANTSAGGAYAIPAYSMLMLDSDALKRGHAEPELVNVFVHELGHSYALLSDEYENEDTAESWKDYIESFDEGYEINVTKNSIPEKLKWRHWIEDFNNVPGIHNKDKKGEFDTGLFEGGLYVSNGVYRSAFELVMRSTYDRLYGHVHQEALFLTAYHFVYSCSNKTFTKINDNRYRININDGDGCDIDTETTDYYWAINGQRQSSGDLNSFTFDLLPCSQAANTIPSLVFVDKTGYVHDAPKYYYQYALENYYFYPNTTFKTDEMPMDLYGETYYDPNQIVYDYTSETGFEKTCQ